MQIPKNKNNNGLRAFTLTELIITVVIITVLATFAVPNYQKSVRKGYERRAILNLKMIHGANEIYNARAGYYVVGVALDLAGINTALGIDIVDGDMTYSYTCDIGYVATAAYPGANKFTVGINQNPITGANPYCFEGSCPSL